MVMTAWILSETFHLDVFFGTNTENNQVEHLYIIFFLLFCPLLHFNILLLSKT